MRETHVRAGVI